MIKHLIVSSSLFALPFLANADIPGPTDSYVYRSPKATFFTPEAIMIIVVMIIIIIALCISIHKNNKK